MIYTPTCLPLDLDATECGMDNNFEHVVMTGTLSDSDTEGVSGRFVIQWFVCANSTVDLVVNVCLIGESSGVEEMWDEGKSDPMIKLRHHPLYLNKKQLLLTHLRRH